jgi:hypothetical protein
MIQQLGLQRHRTRMARTTARTITFGIHEPVRLTIRGCDCVIEVAEHGLTREEHAPANRSAVVRETLS